MADAISVEQFIQQLETLKQEMDAGKLKHGDYDTRLARVIQELRDRKLDADRPKIGAARDRHKQVALGADKILHFVMDDSNPGEASLRAVLEPASVDYLYFGADGSGGHALSPAVADHPRTGARHRRVARRAEKAQGET